MADKRDYYEVLGVDKSADASTIKKHITSWPSSIILTSIRAMRRQKRSSRKSTRLTRCFRTRRKKAKYDQYGHAAFENGGPGDFGGFEGFDFGDIFSSFFRRRLWRRFCRRGGPVRGEDIHARVAISFEEAVFGCKKEVSFGRVQKCAECSGSGAKKGTSAETCKRCGGSGQIRVQQRTAFGMFQSTQVCSECRGSGKIIKEPCSNCRGTGYVKLTKKLRSRFRKASTTDRKFRLPARVTRDAAAALPEI